MKLILAVTLLFFFTNCSFDNKSSIWENADNTFKNKEKNIFKDFKKISSSSNYFNKKIDFNQDAILSTSKPILNLDWSDIFYQKNNNFKNFKYNDLNQIFFKSKKLSRYLLNEHKLYENGNAIISDVKGNIIVYSIIDGSVVAKFNFYKKRYKKIKKRLNIIIENNIIFVADNLGYFYAYNYTNNKVIWAKNFKIPFSSNLKIFKNLIVVSNQSNHLYFVNKLNGDLVKLIPTEETPIKNEFTNNLSIGNVNNLLFLNSFGSLYSIDLNKLNINWFNNYNQTLNISPTNIFFGNTIINNKDEIVVSSNKNTFLVDLKTGSLVKKFNFSSVVKPIIIKNIVFLITRNDFLVAIDLERKKILYSLDLNEIQDSKIKNISSLFKEIMILNSKIFIFLNNSKILIFDINGKFIEVRKLKTKIHSYPIVIEKSILYINKKNKLVVLN